MIHKASTILFLLVILFSCNCLIIPPLSRGDTSNCENLCKKQKYKSLQKKANSGDIKAQYDLSALYYNDKKYADALPWLQRAAAGNDSRAHYTLGLMYLYGSAGVAKNVDAAFKLLEKAADAGNVEASFLLGMLYSYGDESVYPSNNKKSAHYLKIAADAGHLPAARFLGGMYERGTGVEKDFSAAIKWYRLAASDGDLLAKKQLDGAIRRDKIYKALFVDPIEKIKDVSFIEYIIALLLTVIGICLTIRYNKDKLPFYFFTGLNLIKDYSSNLKSLKILYDKKKIDTLTVTNLYFWNAGRATINRDDIISSDPLRLILGGAGKFLDAEIIFSNNASNKFHYDISEDKSIIYVTFDYIDKDDGIILQVFHTNISPNIVDLVGRVKGAGKPKKKTISPETASTKSFIFSILPAVMLIVMAISFGLFMVLNSIEFMEDIINSAPLLVLITVFFMVVLSYIIRTSLIFFKNRLPKGYKEFLENE